MRCLRVPASHIGGTGSWSWGLRKPDLAFHGRAEDASAVVVVVVLPPPDPIFARRLDHAATERSHRNNQGDGRKNSSNWAVRSVSYHSHKSYEILSVGLRPVRLQMPTCDRTQPLDRISRSNATGDDLGPNPDERTDGGSSSRNPSAGGWWCEDRICYDPIGAQRERRTPPLRDRGSPKLPSSFPG
jgi:hypothetical protein